MPLLFVKVFLLIALFCRALQVPVGVPMSRYGCPEVGTTNWTSGSLHFRSSQEGGHMWSQEERELALAGPITTEEFQLNICGLTEDLKWPAGNYCIFRYTPSCPEGFMAEYVTLLPSFTTSLSLAGVIPAEVGHDVIIQFCCQHESDVNTIPEPPFDAPFILIVEDSSCPRFTGMKSTSQFLSLSDVTSGQISEQSPWRSQGNMSGLNLTFCMFESKEEKLDSCEEGWDGFHGYCYQFQPELRSFDEGERKCRLMGSNLHSIHSEEEMAYIQNMTQYLTNVFPKPHQVDFENYWSGLNDIDVEGLWTYSDGTPNEESVYVWSGGEPNDWLSGEDCQEWRIYPALNNDYNCWMPRRSVCKKPRLSVTQEVAAEKPTRQSSTEGELLASLAVDNQLSVTCSQTAGRGDLWWQVDLQEMHVVFGVQLVTGPDLPGPMTISAGLLPDDFRFRSAQICKARLVLAQRVSLIKCVQPITGQYITIEVTRQTPEQTNGDNDMRSTRLELCHVFVYGIGSSCGIPLGLGTGEVSAVHISASSHEERYFPHQARLNTPGAWCAHNNDSTPYLEVNLGSQRVVYGLIVTGADKENLVTSFQLLFQSQAGQMAVYQEYLGVDKTFSVGSPESSNRYVLRESVTTDLIQIYILGSEGRPCLKLDLLECKHMTETGFFCPSYAGVPALDYANLPKTPSAIISGNFFACTSHLVGWEIYFRDVYNNNEIVITIWRPEVADPQVLLAVEVTRLTPLQRGFHSVYLDSPFEVRPGDMVGIHLLPEHDSTHITLQVPYALKGEDGILQTELLPVLFLDASIVNPVPETRMNISADSAILQKKVEAALAIKALLTFDQQMDMGNKCGDLIASEGVLSSPHYPSYYGSSLVCEWNIVASFNKFVKINFLDLDLTSGEASKSMPCAQAGSFSHALCADTLAVNTFDSADFQVNDKTSTLRVLLGQDNTMIISATRFVQLKLSSCIRDSPMNARGFKALVEFTEYYGCCVGKDECAFCACDSWSRGYISSVNHPFTYPSNMACDWRITVEAGNYIELNVDFMDVASLDSKCQQDYIVIRDTTYYGMHTGQPQTFCNHVKPDKAVKSSWHYLLVHFYSDSSTMGKGFLAHYESKKFEIIEELATNINYNGEERGCRSDDVYFNHFCYHFGESERPVVWMQAESACVALGGHLVSIMSEQEMEVLHYLLTTTWRTDRREAYIGLFDSKPRSQFWWTDSRPLIYTAWAPRLDNMNIQPDGADLESCTMIQLSNLHSINHWHDIPCSTDTVHQYICKKPAQKLTAVEQWEIDISGEADCGNELYTCADRGCIQQTFVCDGKMDCKDGHDEFNCTTSCSVNEFQCASGQCVHMSKYCDFVQDCEDLLDETGCVYPMCGSHEWSCDNGQCIPLDRCCDVIPDCVDGSDEIDKHCNLFCSPKDTVQCFWGKCVPRHSWCDTVVDCAGTLEEDERDCAHTRAQTCADVRVMGYPDGHYRVRPALLDQIDIECSFNFHITETKITITGLERNFESNNFGMALFRESRAVLEQVEFILTSADTCRQEVRVSCDPVTCLTAVELTRVDGSDLFLEINHWNCSCSNVNAREVLKPAASDVFFIDGSQILDFTGLLGYAQVFTGNETSASTIPAGKVEVQPIWCSQDTSKDVWPSTFRCKSGQFIDAKYRCILEFNKYGLPFGCRDMSHLLGCEYINVLDKECSVFTSHVQYWGSQARSRDGHVCQRWDVQDPHVHSFRGPELFNFRVVSEQENFCRNPSDQFLSLPVPWCFVANPVETNRETCPVPPCAHLSAFAEWAALGMTVPYEAFAAPCEVLTCDSDVVGVKLPFECPDKYVKCPGHYCIPERYICDNKWHCLNGEDELHCSDSFCPGMYQCQGKPNCLPKYQLCDGIQQCPDGDDEIYCDVLCPPKCSCQGYVYSCIDARLLAMPHDISRNIRKLDISNNTINLTFEVLKEFPFLGELNASNNGIDVIMEDTFSNQANLYNLDLSFNNLKYLGRGIFNGLHHLKHLYLRGNVYLAIIDPGAFNGLKSLPNLDLSGLSLHIIVDDTFQGLPGLLNLSLAANCIEMLEIDAFSHLENLQKLDVAGNELDIVSAATFRAMSSLEFLTSDSFKFCCFASQVPSANCLPPQDEISSCSDLMRNNILRSFLWLLGTTAFIGNIFVVIYRYKYSNNAVSELAILHLGVSDFFMGFYMLGIGSVDAYYRGVYIEYADKWRKGWGCQALGFLATLAAEGSVLFLCLITIDRFICLVFPFGGFKLTPNSAKRTICVIWVLTVILAGLPLLPIPYFGGQFYSRSGVCLALPITAETPPGWEFSTALFIGFNLIGFLVILVGYSVMYIVISRAGKRAKRGKNKAQITLARNMMLIVMTDFVCWLPIIIMGFLALQGTRVSGEVYAWTIVFIMPINSAINPLLYSYASFKQKRAAKKKLPAPSVSSVGQFRKSTAGKGKPGSEMPRDDYRFGEAVVGLNETSVAGFLKVSRPSVKQLLHITLKLAGTMHALHAVGLVHGNINADSVMLASSPGGSKHIVLRGFLFDESNDDFDTSDDMENLGLLLKTMIRSVSQIPV